MFFCKRWKIFGEFLEEVLVNHRSIPEVTALLKILVVNKISV